MEEAARAKDARDAEDVGVSELEPHRCVDDATDDETMKDVDDDEEGEEEGTATINTSKRKREEGCGVPRITETNHNSTNTQEARDLEATVATEGGPPGHVEDENGKQREKNMKRRSTVGGEESGQGGNNHNSLNNSDNNNKRKKNKKHRPHAQPVPGTVATRTRHQQKTNALTSQVSLLLRTLGYLDNDTLMIMCLVCKQIRDLIWTGQGMEKKLVRIFKLSPSKNANDDERLRLLGFLSNMNRYFQNVTKTRILQGFQHWKVQDGYKFNSCGFMDDGELVRRTQNIRMTGIVSLDMSLPLSIARHDPCTLYRAILFMVPNLQELDLSNTNVTDEILEFLADRCPRLEIIRWNDNKKYAIGADGYELQTMNNLKELYFDNWTFEFDYQNLIYRDEGTGDDGDEDDDGDNDNGVYEMEAMLDSNAYPNLFLFHKVCNNPLERISIRNARWNAQYADRLANPQQILMKFVRNAPSTLVWFRSDLAATNIRILQLERPGIEFLN